MTRETFETLERFRRGGDVPPTPRLTARRRPNIYIVSKDVCSGGNVSFTPGTILSGAPRVGNVACQVVGNCCLFRADCGAAIAAQIRLRFW